MPTVRAIARAAERDNSRFSALVIGVVKSAQFQMRVKSEDGAVRPADRPGSARVVGSRSEPTVATH